MTTKAPLTRDHVLTQEAPEGWSHVCTHATSGGLGTLPGDVITVTSVFEDDKAQAWQAQAYKPITEKGEAWLAERGHGTESLQEPATLAPVIAYPAVTYSVTWQVIPCTNATRDRKRAVLEAQQKRTRQAVEDTTASLQAVTRTLKTLDQNPTHTMEMATT